MTYHKHILLNIIVWLGAVAVALPLLLLLIWCFVNRWPFPELLPASWTLRGVDRLFSGYLNIGPLLFSSILLSLFAAFLSTVLGIITARAMALYEFPMKRLISLFILLPVLVPATVYGMGIHMLFVLLKINNTLPAVIIAHILCAMPFSIKILWDITAAAGGKYEEQALSLGAAPIQAFLHGSLPVIAPGVISAMAISFLMSYTQYFLTLLIGGGKIKTLSVIVLPLIEGADRTLSSVYSAAYILSTLSVFLIFQLISNLLAAKNGANIGV